MIMRRHGFTLIEILIAASVLGLGVLGIATLFAGAARQQQLASDQTDSNRVARNIDSLLSDRFERFSGTAMDANPTIPGPYFAPGQWHPVASAPDNTNNGLPHTLLLDLSDNGQNDQTAFGIAALGDRTLYRLSGALLREEWAPGVTPSSTIWGGVGTSASAPGVEFTAMVLDQAANSGDASFPNSIPAGRLHPGFSIEVDVYREDSVPPLGSVVTGLVFVDTYEFGFLNWRHLGLRQADPDLWPNDPDPDPAGSLDIDAGGQNDSVIRLVNAMDQNRRVGVGVRDGQPYDDVTAPGTTSSIRTSWVRLEVQGPNSNDPPFSYLQLSGPASFSVWLPGNVDSGFIALRHTVGEVRAVGLQYREDRLLSLSERLAYRDDEAFPGGRRPSRGAALLYRRTLDGRDQLMSISYTLEALGRVNFDPQTELPFVPPDTFARLYDTSQDVNAYGLFSQVELELGHDANIDRYIIMAKRSQDEWAVEKDQYVVVGASDNPVNPQSANRSADIDTGAASALRVIRSRRNATTGLLEGVLEESPRNHRGRSFLEDRAGPPEPVYVWALRPIVRSDDGGDQSVDWRVRPTGARVITFGGGG